MFVPQEMPCDSQLSSDQMANMLVAEAVEQLQQITGYTKATCESMLALQFVKGFNKQPSKKFNVLEQREVSFISTLFF